MDALSWLTSNSRGKRGMRLRFFDYCFAKYEQGRRIAIAIARPVLSFSYCRSEEVSDLVCRVLLHRCGYVSVGIKRETRAVVPEDAGERFYINAVLERQHREGVAKVVEADFL